MKKNLNKEFFDDLNPEIEKFVNKSVEISDRIEEILKKKNISQRELADKLGKSESEISKWLSGTHNFTIKSIAKIESVLEDEIVYVFRENIEDKFKILWTDLYFSLASWDFFKMENKNIFTYTRMGKKQDFIGDEKYYKLISSKNYESIIISDEKIAA